MNQRSRKFLAGLLRVSSLSLVALGASARAQQQPIYRCVGAGFFQEIKLVDGEWFSRGRGEQWVAAGCKPPFEQTSSRSADCSFEADAATIKTTSAGERPPANHDGPVFEQQLLRSGPSYTSRWTGVAGSSPTRLDCLSYAPGQPAPDEAWLISKKIALGYPVLIAFQPGALTLKPGAWSYPPGRWVVVEGMYHSDRGLWAFNGVGFAPRGNPLHACPAESRCGGIHESGAVLERWYRPEHHELVVFGNLLRFNERGDVLKNGEKVGHLTVPNI